MGQINDYAEKTTAVGTDEYVLQETAGGLTKKITHANFLAAVNDAITTLQNNPSLPYKNITDFELSNDAGDLLNDINILPGRCKDSTGVIDIISPTEMTKRIDAAWAVGDDAGGLDTGSVAADTWYYVFVIVKDSDSSIDYLFSLSKTSPTMPAGYTYFRRLRGAVLTDGTPEIIPFHQSDNYFFFNDWIIELDTAAAGIIRVVLVVSTPPGMIGSFVMSCVDGDVSYIWIDSVWRTDITPDEIDTGDIRVPSSSTVSKHIKTDASGQIAYRPSRSAIHLVIKTAGFIDPAQD